MGKCQRRCLNISVTKGRMVCSILAIYKNENSHISLKIGQSGFQNNESHIGKRWVEVVDQTAEQSLWYKRSGIYIQSSAKFYTKHVVLWTVEKMKIKKKEVRNGQLKTLERYTYIRLHSHCIFMKGSFWKPRILSYHASALELQHW